MFKLLILPTCLLWANSCFSQFNDSIHYYFRFGSTGIINKTTDGNSYVLNNSLAFNTKKRSLSFNTAFNWIYGAQQHRLTNNDFTAHGDVDWQKDLHNLYYWGLVNYDKIYSLKVNHRFQAGLGAAYNILDKTTARINVSDGLLYEQGDLVDAGMGRDIYQTLRNSFRLLYHWSIKDKIVIDGIHFYQPSLAAINDYNIQSTNNFSIKLKKWLNVTCSVVYNKLSRTKRENLLLTYGLQIERYF